MIFLFSKAPRPALASTQIPVQGVPECLPGHNAIAAWNWPLIKNDLEMNGATPLLLLHSFMLWTRKTVVFFSLIWSSEQWNGLASCRYRSAANRASQHAYGYVTHGRTESWWILSIAWWIPDGVVSLHTTTDSLIITTPPHNTVSYGVHGDKVCIIENARCK